MNKKAIPFFILPLALFVVTVACSSETGVIGLLSTPTGTRQQDNLMDLGSTLVVNEAEALLTKQALDNSAEVLAIQMTATAWPALATSTRQAAIEATAANAASIHATEAAHAESVQSTEVANATKIAATQYADATQFAWTQTVYANTLSADQLISTQAAQETAAILPAHQENEIVSLYAQSTIDVGNAEQVSLAVKRQQIKNTADAILPWTLIIVSTLVVGLLGYQVLQVSVTKRDASGAMPTQTMSHKRGKTIFRPDLMTGPAITITRDGHLETMATDKAQEETTRRAQLVDTMRAIPPVQPYQKTAMGMFNSVFGNRGRARIQRMNPSQVGESLNEAFEKFDQEDAE